MAIFYLDIQIKAIAIKCTGSYIYSTLVYIYDANNILFNIFFYVNMELAVSLIEWPQIS